MENPARHLPFSAFGDSTLDNIPWIRIKLPDRLIETNDAIDMKIHELSDFLNAAMNFHKKS